MQFQFLVRDVIYTSRSYATMSVFVCLSVCPSVCPFVTEVHWRIIANLGSNSDPTLQRIAVAVLLTGGSSRAMLASARSIVKFVEVY